MQNSLRAFLPVLAFVGFTSAAVFVPALTAPLIPYPLAAMMRVATVFMLLAVMFSRISARDFEGWTWGYSFVAMLVIALSILTWAEKPAGRVNTLLLFLAACSWVYSSFTQAARIGSKQAQYE